MLFPMWCGRRDDSPSSTVYLVIEFPDGKRTLYTYLMEANTGGLSVVTQDCAFLPEIWVKLGRVFEQDIDEIAATCQDLKFTSQATTPASWVDKIMKDLYANDLITFEMEGVWISIRDLTIAGQ